MNFSGFSTFFDADYVIREFYRSRHIWIPSLVRFLCRLDNACVEALIAEVMAWPKPGLVSPVDSGSHPDMNIDIFLRSAFSLRGFFGTIGLAAALGFGLPVLQRIGMEAERKMLAATGGVNTHRGAFFSLGLLAAAFAKRFLDPSLSCLTCGQIVSRFWAGGVASSRASSPVSHGNIVFSHFAAGGARTEACEGFPTVYRVGIPTLNRLLRAGHSFDEAIVGTLMALIEKLDDTTILWRGGEGGLSSARTMARFFNSGGGLDNPSWRKKLLIIHDRFVSMNLSPGGSADLLSASIMLCRLGEPRTNE